MRSALLTPLVVFALSACDKEPKPEPHGDTSILLSRFTSCDALRSYETDVWTEYLVQSLYGWGWGIYTDANEGDGGEDEPSDWSATNVQEEGVDEPDLVKTDGSYFYIVQNGELDIVAAWPPADARLVSTLALDGGPFASFLYGDRLAVLSYYYDDTYGSEEGSGAADSDLRYGSAARITVIDVSDPTNPQELRQVDVEGWYTAARMIGSDVYLVAQTWAAMPEGIWQLGGDPSLDLPVLASDATDAERTAAKAVARAILRPRVAEIVGAMTEDDLLPRYRDQVPGEDAALVPLETCSDVYRTANLSLPANLVLAHLDLAEGDAGSDLSATSVMADGWTVYASPENLYVAQTSWSWFWDSADPDLDTQIHKFALAGADSVYEGSGEVSGWLLNQYSMSEYSGDLRVATTDINAWWGGAEDTGQETEDLPANNVFVLRQDEDALDTVGSLTGLAPNERIYAARFMGSKGYLVTYQQIDPLFTLDLSDPTDPTLVGELEVQGYSSYLHPAGDDHLLAVGMEATPDGMVTGFDISLFDVSDLAAPTLNDRLTATSDEWSWSEAMWDPHAFTYYNGILSVPLYTYDYDNETGNWKEFSGLWVVAVDETAGTLTELGRIDHADLVADSECLYGDWEGCESTYWYAWMRRSVVVEDYLYSISDYGVKVNEQAAPDNQLATVLFHPKE